MEALNCLENYHWPGNIRELRNVIHRATIFSQDVITIKEIPPEIRDSNPLEQIIGDCSICFNKNGMDLNQILACIEYKLILEAMRKSKGNQSHAAKLLDLSLSTFRDRLKKYKQKPSDCDEAF